MRTHMRVKGLLWSVRGTLAEVNPHTGTFRVSFDLPIGTPDDHAQEITFAQSGSEVVDSKWGLTWDIIS